MGKGRQKAAAAAMAAAAVVGVATGTVFESPADLMQDPEAIVLQQTEEEDGFATEERQKKPVGRIRGWVLGLPSAVRMLVGVPLWAIGWVVMTGLSTFFAGAMTPVAARLLGWLCLALILVVVYALSVKAAFPKLPFRKILRGPSLLFLLGLTALLALADLALPSAWQGDDRLTQWVWRIGATCLLAASCCSVWERYGGEEFEETKPYEEMSQAELRATARALADSVSPRR